MSKDTQPTGEQGKGAMTTGSNIRPSKALCIAEIIAIGHTINQARERELFELRLRMYAK